MSGIVGILQQSGEPMEPGLLQALVQFLHYRGTDQSEIWTAGNVGLGHTLLRTTRESLAKRQPASLDGHFWITADARLDSREELIEKLKRSGGRADSSATDAELILQAYAAWGAQCVEHLRGEFSFGVWDAGQKTLFCARDHFGIKPFYYAALGNSFVFSNTLNCVRLHPDVSGELNEAAIGDFLLFGLNCNEATTTFRDIQRLPPAHCLTLSPKGLNIRRYWAPPTDGRIRYARDEDYVEKFRELMRCAVEDRLRTERAGILLSGGLDSSSVAAVAKEVAAKSTQTREIRGYTHVYESLIPDRDGEYARETGAFLGIPMRFLPMDSVQVFEGWGDPEFSLPEPVDAPHFAGFSDSCRIISAECRVLLSGEGVDNLMDFQMWPYLRDLRRNGEWRRLFTEAGNYLWVRPFPWRGILTRAKRLIGKDPEIPKFPTWLARDFVRRANLEARWKDVNEHPVAPSKHPILPNAHASFSLPQWTLMFEQENAGVTPYALEVRYPFLDLRIVNYLLALPPFPWFFQKTLLREAMAGRLPERVRMRPKTPLQGDPVLEQVRRTGAKRLEQIAWSAEMEQFVKRSAVVAPHGKMTPVEISDSLRPCCFNIWLQSARKVRYNLHAEARNG